MLSRASWTEWSVEVGTESTMIDPSHKVKFMIILYHEVCKDFLDIFCEAKPDLPAFLL